MSNKVGVEHQPVICQHVYPVESMGPLYIYHHEELMFDHELTASFSTFHGEQTRGLDG